MAFPRLLVAAAQALAAVAVYNVPTVTLQNSALPGTIMPAMGLGTGGYSHNASTGWGSYPECWDENTGCGPWVYNATMQWLNISLQGGEQISRIDNGNSYDDVVTIGQAIKQSKIPRERIFLLQKVGSPYPMGYNDTMQQFKDILTNQSLKYVDALLIHWPTSTGASLDPACQMQAGSYDPKECRLNTWRAMLDIFNTGGALAIGVSNYNKSQIEEIVDAGLPLPAINQIPIHLYRSSSQMETIEYCQRLGITVNAYSPLGVPDWHSFPAAGGMSPTPLVDPVVLNISKAHGRTPAAVLINWLWQLNIVTNPRSVQPVHMDDNLGAYNFSLNTAEVALLSSRPQDWCSIDSGMYECAYDNFNSPPAHPWEERHKAKQGQ